MDKPRYKQVPISKVKVGQHFWTFPKNKKYPQGIPVHCILEEPEHYEFYLQAARAEMLDGPFKGRVTEFKQTTRVWVRVRRFKMVELGRLEDGDIFWAYTSGRALRGNKWYSTPRVPFKAKVVYPTRGGMKIEILHSSGSTPAGTKIHTGRGRMVFVEV